jgi:hypothetical protein
MTRSQYIHYGVIALTVILFSSCDSKLKEKLAVSEERVKWLEKERDQYRAEKDKVIAENLRLDSLLSIRQTQTIIKYERVAPAVLGLNKDGLRRAFTNY